MAMTDDYSKTTWINGSSPALNENNLNKIEQGIYDNREYIQTLNSRDTYFTPETSIGTWIDGKTIYRKIIEHTSTLPGGTSYVAHGVTNIGTYRKVIPLFYISNGAAYGNTIASSTAFVSVDGVNDTNIGINVGATWANVFTKTILILEYTKTTG